MLSMSKETASHQSSVIDLRTSSSPQVKSDGGLFLCPTPSEPPVVIDLTSSPLPPAIQSFHQSTSRPSTERVFHQQQLFDERGNLEAEYKYYTNPGSVQYNPLSLLGEY